MVSQIITSFATSLSNCANAGKSYMRAETVNGREVIIKGTGYNIEVFTVNSVNCKPDFELVTKNQFKFYIINAIVEN